MGLREIEPPPIPTDALLKLYDLLSCNKIMVIYAVLDLAARPVNAPSSSPSKELSSELAALMDKLFLVLIDVRAKLSSIEINKQSDINKIREEPDVKELGRRLDGIKDDIDTLIDKHKGLFFRK